MAAHCSFGIGGPADLYLRPDDEAGLVAAVALANAEGIPCFILGGGANILVGDRGIRGLVVDTGELADCRISGRSDGSGLASEGSGLLSAGSGLSIDALCLEALSHGLAGLQDFFGMPGTLGGAIYMNARCYDTEISAVLSGAMHAGRDGSVARYEMDPADWSYKRSPFQPGGRLEGRIILSAEFRLPPGDSAASGAIMRSRRADREAKGHYRLPSAGSVFKNDRAFGRPTGAILDSLGMRGVRVGNAAVSDWHANIFVNLGGASAADMRALVRIAIGRARSALGIDLEPEIMFIGED